MSARPILLALLAPFALAAAPMAEKSAKPLCTTASRNCLMQTATAYFDAILKADGSKVPFAADVRVTEQGEVMATTRAGIVAALKTTGATKGLRNMRMLVDEASGEVAVLALSDVRFGDEPPYTVRRIQRMKIVRGLITEVELVLVKDTSPTALWPDA